MRRVIKVSIFIILGVLILFGTSAVLYFSNVVLPWEKKEIVAIAIEWGDLADLPSNAEILMIEKRGSAFTRQFVINFSCNSSDFNTWVEQSKGLKSVLPTKIVDDIIKYVVQNHDLGTFGYVTFNRKENIVQINISWS